MSQIVKIGNHQFNIDDLRRRHMMAIPEFEGEIERIQMPDGRYLYYQDNGGDILAVAHLDATMEASHFEFGHGHIGKNKAEYPLIWSPMVDDRLGVFTIMNLLPPILKAMGLPAFDILLTEDEESMRSTAAYFNGRPDGRRYRWMFQFDRGGMDAVHYQYTNPDWTHTLRKFFGKVEYGIGSDICFLEHLGCQGVNVGTAYYNYTSPEAFANLAGLSLMVDRFLNFYKECAGKFFFHQREEFRTLTTPEARTILAQERGWHTTQKQSGAIGIEAITALLTTSEELHLVLQQGRTTGLLEEDSELPLLEQLQILNQNQPEKLTEIDAFVKSLELVSAKYMIAKKMFDEEVV